MIWVTGLLQGGSFVLVEGVSKDDSVYRVTGDSTVMEPDWTYSGVSSEETRCSNSGILVLSVGSMPVCETVHGIEVVVFAEAESGLDVS